MVDVSVDDLTQLYLNTLVLYKNKPIFVDGIGKTKKVTYFDLSTQRNMVVDYKEGIFKAPTRRIGFINIGKSVVYSYRNPVRRYKIGYSHENLKFLTIEVSYPESRSITKERAMSLKSPEIRDSIFNSYPSFETAFMLAKEFNGAYAFDKQFAVCCRNRVWYKTDLVGTVNDSAKTIYDIVFDKEYAHLTLLLDNNYEKATSISRI